MKQIENKININLKQAIIIAVVLTLVLFAKVSNVNAKSSLGTSYQTDIAMNTVTNTMELASDSKKCMHLVLGQVLCSNGQYEGMNCNGHIVQKLTLDGSMAFCIDPEKTANPSACYTTDANLKTSEKQAKAYNYAASQGTDFAYFVAQMYLWNEDTLFYSNLEAYYKYQHPGSSYIDQYKFASDIASAIRNSSSTLLPVAVSYDGESQRFVSDAITDPCQVSTDPELCCENNDSSTYYNKDFGSCCHKDGSDCKCEPPSGSTQCGTSSYSDPVNINCIAGNNTYADDSNFTTDLYKKYCAVFCREDVKINTPNNNPTFQAGRYFVIGNSLNFTNPDPSYNPLFGYITASGSRTCYVYTNSTGSTSGINLSGDANSAGFIKDYTDIYNKIPQAYGDYLTAKSKYAALTTAAANPVTDSEELKQHSGCFTSSSSEKVRVSYQAGKMVDGQGDCLYGVPDNVSGDSCTLLYARAIQKRSYVCDNIYGCTSEMIDKDDPPKCLNGKVDRYEYCDRRTYTSDGNYSDNTFLCGDLICYGCYGGSIANGQTCDEEQTYTQTNINTDGYKYYNSQQYTVYDGFNGYTNWTPQYGCINGDSIDDAIASAAQERDSAWANYTDLVAQLTALRDTLVECSGRDSSGNAKINYNFNPEISAVFDNSANSPYSYNDTLVSTTVKDDAYIYPGDRNGTFYGGSYDVYCSQDGNCYLGYYECDENSKKCSKKVSTVIGVNVKSIAIVRDITKSYSSTNYNSRYSSKDTGYTSDDSTNAVDIGGNVIPLSFKLPVYSELAVNFTVSNIGHNGHFSSYNLGGELSCQFNVKGTNIPECAEICKKKYKLYSDEFYSCVVNETTCCKTESEYATLCPPNDGGGDGGSGGGNGGGGNILGTTVIYRTIQLQVDSNNTVAADNGLSDQDASFPSYNGNGRTPGANWTKTDTYNGNPNTSIGSGDVAAYITNNRNTYGNSVYQKTPLYTISLTPSLIKQIRQYNKEEIANNNGGYADFSRSMSCNSSGLNCISDFIHTKFRAYFDAGQSKCLDINDSTFDSCRY